MNGMNVNLGRLGHVLVTVGSVAASLGTKFVQTHSEQVAENMGNAIRAAYHLGRHHEREGIDVPEHLLGSHVAPGAGDVDEDQGAELGPDEYKANTHPGPWVADEAPADFFPTAPLVDMDALRRAVDDQAPATSAAPSTSPAAAELEDQGAELADAEGAEQA